MYRVRIRGAIAVVALAVAGMPMLAAQERPAEIETYRMPGLTFTPGISFGAQWDSNVGVADPLGKPESGNLFTMEPFGQLELRSPRTEFLVGYKGYIRRYADLDELNGTDQRGYLSWRHLATRRLTVFARNEYTRVPSTDELELNGLPFSRVGSQSNRLTGGLEARLTKYTDLNVRYENVWAKFEKSEGSLSDRLRGSLNDGSINSLQTDLRRRLSERLSVGGEYSIRRADLEGGTRTAWFQDTGGLIAYALGPHTKVTVSGGYSFLNDNRADRDRSGPYLRGEILHAGDHATFGAGYLKSFVPTFAFGGSTASQELRAHIHRPLTQGRVYVRSSASWRRTDPMLPETPYLDTIHARTSLGFAIAPWLRFETFHIFTRQDSSVVGSEINRQRAGAQIVVSQPMRIR